MSARRATPPVPIGEPETPEQIADRERHEVDAFMPPRFKRIRRARRAALDRDSEIPPTAAESQYWAEAQESTIFRAAQHLPDAERDAFLHHELYGDDDDNTASGFDIVTYIADHHPRTPLERQYQDWRHSTNLWLAHQALGREYCSLLRKFTPPDEDPSEWQIDPQLKFVRCGSIEIFLKGSRNTRPFLQHLFRLKQRTPQGLFQADVELERLHNIYPSNRRRKRQRCNPESLRSLFRTLSDAQFNILFELMSSPVKQIWRFKPPVLASLNLQTPIGPRFPS